MDLVKFAFFVISFYLSQQGSAAPLCQDKHPKCSEYAIFCSSYDHIRQRCPRTCNQCEPIVSPSLPVTLSASLQSTRVATNSLAPTQSTMVTFHSQVPKQSTSAVSQAPSPTQSTEAVSRTQGVVDLLHNFTEIHTTEDVLHGLTSSPTESTNADVLEPNYVGSDRVKEENNAIRATASTADIARAKVVIILAVLWNFFKYVC